MTAATMLAMGYRPALSASTWRAAHEAAERCIPRLVARGHLEAAVNLARRSRQFAQRAAAADQEPQVRPFPDIVEAAA